MRCRKKYLSCFVFFPHILGVVIPALGQPQLFHDESYFSSEKNVIFHTLSTVAKQKERKHGMSLSPIFSSLQQWSNRFTGYKEIMQSPVVLEIHYATTNATLCVCTFSICFGIPHYYVNSIFVWPWSVNWNVFAWAKTGTLVWQLRFTYYGPFAWHKPDRNSLLCSSIPLNLNHYYAFQDLKKLDLLQKVNGCLTLKIEIT